MTSGEAFECIRFVVIVMIDVSRRMLVEMLFQEIHELGECYFFFAEVVGPEGAIIERPSVVDVANPEEVFERARA